VTKVTTSRRCVRTPRRWAGVARCRYRAASPPQRTAMVVVARTPILLIADPSNRHHVSTERNRGERPGSDLYRSCVLVYPANVPWEARGDSGYLPEATPGSDHHPTIPVPAILRPRDAGSQPQTVEPVAGVDGTDPRARWRAG
jgi:hypothetical protein